MIHSTKHQQFRRAIGVRLGAFLSAVFLLSTSSGGAAEAALEEDLDHDHEALRLENRSPKGPWEKGSVAVGGFAAAFDSSLAFGVEDLAGIEISAEDALGLDSTLTVFKAGALYRPGKTLRHQIDFSYASYQRKGDATLTEELVIDGEVLVPGTNIESEFGFQLIQAHYSYAVLQDDRMRIALGLGVYGVPIRYGIDVTTPGDDRELEIRDAVFPLPTLSLRSDFLLVERLYLATEINAMYLEISDFQGSLIDVSLGLEYRPWNHLAFGAALNALSAHVEAKDSHSDYPGIDFVGSIDMRFAGLMIYGKITF